MLNKLYVGFQSSVELPRSGFLFIDDEVPDIPKAKVFDPREHSFNPLQRLSYKRARELAEVLYTISPQGENTLTVRNGKRTLLKALLKAKRFDKIRGDEEVDGMMSDLLASPVLRRVFCEQPNFLFNPVSRILARINRAELGEFDAFVLGAMLMSHFKGQVVVPDFGFYGREVHAGLMRERRIIAGVYTLAELPPKLRQNALLIKDKVASGTTAEDADTLARYARLMPGTNGYNDFVQGAMA